MATRNQTKSFLTLAAIFALSLSANSALGALVAYYPLDDGPIGSTVTGADDIIDDPTHGATDATPNSNGDTWVVNPIVHPLFDPTGTRTVLRTTEGNRHNAGTQDIDLNDGFSWSLWANVASSNATDPNADSIIGVRGGNPFHKVDAGGGVFNGINNWLSINGNLYNVQDDNWHHIAYVGDTTGASLYIDGVLIGSDATTSNGLNTFNGALEFGGTSRFSEDITGFMSDLSIWNERLSEERIRDLANGGSVLVSAVPEPATATLAMLGLGGLVMRRRPNAA